MAVLRRGEVGEYQQVEGDPFSLSLGGGGAESGAQWLSRVACDYLSNTSSIAQITSSQLVFYVTEGALPPNHE
jgi:hypothetical protein